MIVRKIRPYELKRAHELCALSFEYAYEYDHSLSSEELLAKITAQPGSRGDLAWEQHWAAFEDDDQTMMSNFLVIPYPVHFDGHHTSMMGIGGVVTLPPYRRRGGIRACFEAALPDMYQRGAVFSYLYPFSTSYYRKFGYEMCCERNRYQLLIEKIPSSKVSGAFHLVEQGNLWLSEIQTIYRAWQETYNMMVIGEEMEFKWVSSANPFKDQQYSYVYLSADGSPKSYVTFHKVDEPDGRNLHCTRFMFTDPEGFYGIMSLFVSLGADHRYVTFELPSYLPVEPLLPEWSMNAGKCEKKYGGMARVINVHEALKLARTKGEGSLVLHIRDSQIPQNHGTFSIRFANGRVTDIDTTPKPPDVSMDIADFSRLLLGVYDVHMIRFMQGVTIYTWADALPGLFYPKPLFIGEFF